MNWIADIFARIVSDVVWLGASIAEVTSDIFWDTATSAPVLMLLAITAAAAFVVANIPVIAQLIPGVAAFQRLALIVQVVGFAALFFLSGFRVADDRAASEQLKNDLAWSEFQLDQQRKVADAADELKREADARAAAAESELDEYKTRFGGKASPCDPPAGYLDWLHELQRRPRAARADKPQRGLVARLRAAGGQRP